MSVTEFDAIVAGLATVQVASADEARALLDEVLERSGGVLSRSASIRLAEETGWSARTLYRWAKERSESSGEARPSPVYDTFLDAIEAEGSSRFRFDELALTTLYLLGGNVSRFREEVIAAGYPMPSQPTLSRLWRSTVSPMVRDGARHGQMNRYRKMFYVRHSARVPDEAWQLDAFSLDLRVLLEDPSGTSEEAAVGVVARRGWKQVRPQLLLLIDDFSRFIPAWALLDHDPTGADTCCLLADAYEVRPDDAGTGVAIGGPPARIVCDNAGAFRSLIVEGVVARLGTQLAPAPAYTPPAKGKVERVGQTIQASVVTGVAGVVTQAHRRNGTHALEVGAQHWLRFTDLESIVAEVIHRYNYERPHSALSGATPFSKYSTRSGPLRRFDDETLAKLYLPLRHAAGIRRVQPDGVVALGSHWLDPHLNTNLIGTDVQVRSLHHRVGRLALFSADGEKFQSMVVPSTSLTTEERSALMAGRIAESISVSHYAKAARQALEERTAALSTKGDASPLIAAHGVVGHTTTGEGVVGAEDGPASTTTARTKSKPNPASGNGVMRASSSVGKGTRSSPQPSKRPPKPDKGVPVVHAGAKRPKGRRTNEAALDAELRNKR